MKKLFIALTIVWITTATYAQQPNYLLEYGKVSGYELGMTEYTPDKDAEAVVLYELGRYFFTTDYTKGFILNMEVKTKIKILSQAGIKYAEFEIPYYVSDDIEEIYMLEGTTYNIEEGKLEKTLLDKKTVYEEQPAPNWRVKKFAMPNVREGSIVELRYTIRTPYFFNMREWQFQKKIPVVYSMLEYRAIPYYEYAYIVKGTNKLDEFSEEVLFDEQRFGQLVYKEVAYKMGMKNLPAFRDEEFITSEKDYMISLNYQIAQYNSPYGGKRAVMSTWPLICDGLLKSEEFGKYIKSSEKLMKKNLPMLGLTGNPDEELVKKIVAYVKMNYNWNGFQDKYSSLKVSEFEKRKVGNSADINLFLTGMLKAAGFEANPIALSTRKNGMVSKRHPFVQFLNYVIVQVELDGKTHFFDATESMLHFDELPVRCTNVNGLVVKPKSEEWFFIDQKTIASTKKVFNITFNESADTMKINTEVTSQGYDAYNYRSVYKNDESKLVTMLRKQDIEPIGEIKTQKYLEADQPFSFSYYHEPAVEQADNKLFIAPFLNQSVTENIFKQEKRTLPIDLILYHAAEYESTIEIPEGYEVEFLPESKNRDTRLMSLNYQIKQTGNKIQVKGSYQFKKNIYDSREYQPLKVSYDWLISKFNEMIVLVKTK